MSFASAHQLPANRRSQPVEPPWDIALLYPLQGSWTERDYWIVDPESQQVVVLVLDGATYRQHGVFAPGETATSSLLSGLAVSVTDLFASGPDEHG